MQGVLGCLFAMGIMLLMLGTELKAQAAHWVDPAVVIDGITYGITGGSAYVSGYDETKAGKEVHIPAVIHPQTPPLPLQSRAAEKRPWKQRKNL